MKPKKLAIMFGVSFVVMFLSTYAMIDVFDHLYLNINRLYMAGLMTGLMGIINVFVMWDMYKSKKVKFAVLGISAVVVISTFILMRTQTPVGNKSFLRSMIPHHSSAIVMCEESNITDPEIEELCDDIIDTQLREIEVMKEILERY